MAAPVADIIEKITAAFPAQRPADMALVEPHAVRYPRDEYAQIESAFGDKDDWTSVDPAFLDQAVHSDALHFMSDAALRFYIPAYMIADLREKLGRVEPSLTLIRGFDDQNMEQVRRDVTPLYEKWGKGPPPQYDFRDMARRQWAPLSTAQVDAIIAYLEAILERDGPSIGAGAAEALATYWYPRAGR